MNEKCKFKQKSLEILLDSGSVFCCFTAALGIVGIVATGPTSLESEYQQSNQYFNLSDSD